MEVLVNMLIGSVATIAVGWILAKVNKKAFAKMVNRWLAGLIKDQKALNKIENSIGFFFIQVGTEIISATPDFKEQQEFAEKEKDLIRNYSLFFGGDNK